VLPGQSGCPFGVWATTRPCTYLIKRFLRLAKKGREGNLIIWGVAVRVDVVETTARIPTEAGAEGIGILGNVLPNRIASLRRRS